MSKQKIYCLLSLFSLILGTCIYVLFRENCKIGIVASNFSIIQNARELAKPFAFAFVKFYFPDFLWGFSLCCGLFAIHTPDTKGCLICTGIAFSIGCIWELLQYTGYVSGTGDLCDIFMYLSAGILCIIINNIGSNGHEKN